MKNSRVGLPTAIQPLKVNLKTKIRDLTISRVRSDILFASVDGVLHPKHKESLERIETLNLFFSANKSFRLVLTSHWRCEMDQEFFEDKFAPLLPVTLGFTPLLPTQTHRREAEILAFAKHFNINSMAILDCDIERFNKLRHLVVQPDPYIGVQGADLKQLPDKFIQGRDFLMGLREAV